MMAFQRPLRLGRNSGGEIGSLQSWMCDSNTMLLWLNSSSRTKAVSVGALIGYQRDSYQLYCIRMHSVRPLLMLMLSRLLILRLFAGDANAPSAWRS